MTTKNSPVATLRAQAERIAATLHAAGRGERVANDPEGKIAASIAKGEVTVGIVMDDKVIRLTIPWATILETGKAALVEWILAQMREQRLQA